MPVIINEFEVISAPAPSVQRAASNGEAVPERKTRESGVTLQALRTADMKALRVWAH